MTSHSASNNCVVYVDMGGYRSQETSHFYYCNRVTRVNDEGRGGYRSPNSRYYPPNQGERVRLLDFSVDTVGGDGRFGYRSHTILYLYQIVYVSGYSTRQGIRTEDINHYFLLNVGETVDGVGRSGFRSQDSPSPSHN